MMRRGTPVAMFLFAAYFVSLSSAAIRIPSQGSTTAASYRRNLGDADFLIKMENSKVIIPEDKSMTQETASVSQYKVLGLSDVQATVERVHLNMNKSFPSHSHPRGSETLYVESGLLSTSLRFEGLTAARIVRLNLRRGFVTVFPQGLPHKLRCTSLSGCTYISFFNTADPGDIEGPEFPQSDG